MRPLIRDASPFDVPEILGMLRRYRRRTPLAFLAEANDAAHVTQLLAGLMAGKGVVLVAETDKVVGLMMAMIAPSAWSPKHLVLTEMAYWVNQEARGGSAGHRLISAYVERGKALKEQKRIAAFFISKMVNSPDLRYDRFGFTKLEEMWVA